MEATRQTKQYEVAEIELIYKPKVKPSARPSIKESQDIHKILRDTWDENKLELLEQFRIVLLNRVHRVLGIVDISTGAISCTVVDPKIIFGAAVKAAVTHVILAHNHPSGSLRPSESDITLTKKLKEGGLLLEIIVMDHVILTAEGYYSFADNGLM